MQRGKMTRRVFIGSNAALAATALLPHPSFAADSKSSLIINLTLFVLICLTFESTRILERSGKCQTNSFCVAWR